MNGKCTVCKSSLPCDYGDLCHGCFEALPKVRIFSPCGPCLTGYRRVRVNRKSVTVATRNGSGFTCDRVTPSWVHEEPCPSCTDSERTLYPLGHMD